MADENVAAPIIPGQRDGEVGWPLPFFGVDRLLVIDHYPLRLREHRNGHLVWGAYPQLSALWSDALPPEVH